MMRWITLLLVPPVLLLAACGDEEAETFLPTSTSAPQAAATTQPTPPPPPAPDGTVTIFIGVVQDVALSARVITLGAPVQGFTTVAIEDGTEFALAEGGAATLKDIAPGMSIRASGRLGTPGTLIASKVVIFAPIALTPLPEPPPGEANPPDFREFAGLVARAAAEGDTVFFASRVRAEPYTCTEIEVTQGGLGGAEPGLCQEAGQQLDLVLLCRWRSECVYTRPERLAMEMEDYFAQALPAEEDDFGTGEVRLFATATLPPGFYEGRALRTAILTAITSGPEGLVRTARGVDFEFVEGRWVIRGMMVVDVLADEVLSPETAPFTLYEEFERY